MKHSLIRALAHCVVVVGLVCTPGCDALSKKDGDSAAKTSEGNDAAPGGDKKTEETTKAAVPGLPAAEELLAKAVDAAGGMAAFDKIQAFYYSGHLEVAGQKLEAEITLWWKNGDFYTEQNMVGVGQVRAGKSGTEIWSEDPIQGLRQLSGGEAEQVAWLSSLMLAAEWQRYFNKAETTEEKQEAGSTLYVVKLSSESGAEAELLLDKATGLQMGLSFTQQSPMGDIPVSSRMSDYRDFEGMKLSFTQVTEMPLGTATMKIRELKLNPEVSTARFAMPKSATETVTKPAVPQ